MKLFRIPLKRNQPLQLCEEDHGGDQVTMYQCPTFEAAQSGQIRGPKDIKTTVTVGYAANHAFELELSLHDLREITQRANDMAARMLAPVGQDIF